MAQRWEGDKNLAFINPACCQAVSNSALCPLFFAGIFGLFFVLAVLVAIAANFYLSDTSEYLEFSDKAFSVWELLFVIGCLLVFIGFGIYWGFTSYKHGSVQAPSTTAPGCKAETLGNSIVPAQHPNDPFIVRDQFGKITNYKDPNFTPITLEKVYGGNVPPSAYLQGAQRDVNQANANTISYKPFESRTKNPILTLSPAADLCGSKPCAYRFGILAINAKIISQPGKLKGTDAARSLFFADTNANDDFQLVYGSTEDLNGYFASFAVDNIDVSKPTTVLFKGNLVEQSALDPQGLKMGEAPNPVSLQPQGQVFSSFEEFQVQSIAERECFYDNSCASTLECAGESCRKGFVFHCSEGTIDLQVPFHVLDVNGKEVNYDERSLRSDSYFVHESTQYLIPSLNMQGTHTAHITLPRPMRNNIFVSLAVVDEADHYLPFNKAFIVPGNAKNVYQIQPALLLTKDGKGCVGSANSDSCFAGKLIEFNTVQVWAFDSETNAPLSDLSI